MAEQFISGRQGDSNSEPKLGDLLQLLRKKRGLSGREFASQIGVSPSAITQWEHNRRVPRDVGVKFSLLRVLQPDELEATQLAILMEIPASSGNPIEAIDLLERKVKRAERIHELLGEEIGDMRRLISGLRMSQSE